MNSLLGTFTKAVVAIVSAGIGSSHVKTMSVDLFSEQSGLYRYTIESEMEKGHVLEWWPSQQS